MYLLTLKNTLKPDTFSTWHRIQLHLCSFLLTVVNIICIIVTGIIILKVKQVTSDKIPQRNHSFWKQDIKVHREYNKTIKIRGYEEEAALLAEARGVLGIDGDSTSAVAAADGGLEDTFLQVRGE